MIYNKPVKESVWRLQGGRQGYEDLGIGLIESLSEPHKKPKIVKEARFFTCTVKITRKGEFKSIFGASRSAVSISIWYLILGK
jgi:hypothetical protein